MIRKSILAIVAGLALVLAFTACDEVPDLAVPDTPTGLSATVVSATQIHLTWNAVEGAAEYVVVYSTSANGTYKYLGEVTTPGGDHYGLQADTTYYYKVNASNQNGESPLSDYVFAKTYTAPAAPTGLTATATSSSRIDLSWNAVPGAAGYYVYLNISATGNYIKLEEAITSTSTYGYGLDPDTTYYFKVSAFNINGEGPQSNYVSATTLSNIPAAPTNVNAIAVSSSQINITWNAVPGATGYNVYADLSATGTFDYLLVATPTPGAINSELSPGITIYYKITAFNSNGEGPQSNYVSATTLSSSPTNPPAAPTGVTAIAVSPSQINVNWNPVSDAVGYYVYRSLTATGTYIKSPDPFLTPGIENTGLVANTTVYYKISAYNSNGEGPQSSYVSATTLTIMTLERSTGDGYDVWNIVYDAPLTTGKIEAGETYRLTYSLTSNVAISDLWIAFIDNSSGAPGNWQRISEYRSINDIPANTPTSGTLDIPATVSASSDAAAANRMQIGVDYVNAASAPTLTFTTFTLVKR